MSQILFGDDVRFKNGIVYPIQGTSDTTYNITEVSGENNSNEYGLIILNSNPVTVNLPSDQNGLENGRTYQIIAGTEDIAPNITIDAGSNTINGATTAIINTARTSLTIMFTNATSEWHII